MDNDKLTIRGAREHNLKNINLEIPRNRFVVVTGLSGSGKSTLAFDIIFAEGQRRYVESLSAYARQFLGMMERPDVDFMDGLSRVISVDQKTTNRNPRSTVGTVTDIYDFLRLLYVKLGRQYCPECNVAIEPQSADAIAARLLREYRGERISSRDPRDVRNPLFPINHTLAMMRDSLSRLVRRTWAASKKKERLALHAWVWIAYRNYIRGITNRARAITPAMVVGVMRRSWRIEELLAFEPQVALR